jgi:hypothetical protein
MFKLTPSPEIILKKLKNMRFAFSISIYFYRPFQFSSLPFFTNKFYKSEILDLELWR